MTVPELIKTRPFSLTSEFRCSLSSTQYVPSHQNRIPVTPRSVRGPDQIGSPMQVGAGHWAAKVPNAGWCRRQRRTKREKDRQLQARPLHQRGRCHPPVATRGYSYAPRAEKAPLMTTETTAQHEEEISRWRKTSGTQSQTKLGVPTL